MQFTEALAHLCVSLREPYGEFIELWRALREGAVKLEADERKLNRKAAAEAHAIDWGESGFRNLLRGKSGPGGGLEATPIRLSYFLVGYLCDSPRTEVAEQAMAMAYAAPRERTVCPITRKRFFLPALAAVISDAKLLMRCADIGVSSSLGAGYIDFLPPGEEARPGAMPPYPGGTRSMFGTPAYASRPKGSYSTFHLYPFVIREPMALILSGDGRPARAARRSYAPTAKPRTKATA